MTISSSASQSSQPSKQTPPVSSSPDAVAGKATSALTSTSTPYNHAVDSPVVEGESSLAAHGNFANEFLKNAVQAGSLQDASLEMRETLDSLHHIVNSLNKQTAATEMLFPNANVLPRPSYKGYEMPPVHAAVSLLNRSECESSLCIYRGPL